MPAVRIMVDEVVIATVSTAGMTMIDVATSLGTTVGGVTADGIESLALSVVWHADDGNRADIRLSATAAWPTLEDIGNSYLLRETMALGGSVMITVG